MIEEVVLTAAEKSLWYAFDVEHGRRSASDEEKAQVRQFLNDLKNIRIPWPIEQIKKFAARFDATAKEQHNAG
jgi:hypothetical protein